MPPQVVVNKTNIQRVSMLLWGTPGCGKTYFANTAPGKRLFINFDPDGTSGLPASDDTLVADWSMEPDRLVDEAKSTNPFNLEGIFKEHPDIATVIVDSVTAFVTRATAYSQGHKNAPGSVFENPGPSGYGFRNRFALGLCKSVLQCTGKHSKHVIFCCHEDVGKTNSEGSVVAVTILLGGSLPREVPLQISEVWRIADRSIERAAQIRNVGVFEPMKTRMFNNTKGHEFVISSRAQPDKIKLADLFQKWQENGYNKLELPV